MEEKYLVLFEVVPTTYTWGLLIINIHGPHKYANGRAYTVGVRRLTILPFY